MGLTITWDEPAVLELEAILEFIAMDNPAAARRLHGRILAKVEGLTRFPNKGRRIPELGEGPYRELIEPPCRIFYAVGAKEIEIVGILRSERLLDTERFKP